MRPRPEQRYKADFRVFLTWEHRNGTVRRVAGRCVDLSPSGARLETKDKLELRSTILLHSEQFGRMGTASVRYCALHGMTYRVGLQFSTAFRLSDPVRKKALDLVRKTAVAPDF
jgi:hypothetical protein